MVTDIGTLLNQLNTSIEQTELLKLFALDRGLTYDEGLQKWVELMQYSGLLPDWYTGIEPTTGESPDYTQIINVMTSMFNQQTNELLLALENQSNNYTSVLDGLFLQTQDNIISALTNMVQAIDDRLDESTQQQIQLMLSVEQNIHEKLTTVESSLTNKTATLLGTTNTLINQSETRMIQASNEQTALLLDELSNLNVQVETPTIDIDIPESSWTNSYIEELLTVLANGFLDLKNKEFTVNIDDNNTGNDGNDSNDNNDTDSSANIIGTLLDPLNLIPFFADLLGNVSDSDNTANNDALQLLMQWGKGEFDSIAELQTAFLNAGIGGSIFNLLWNVLGGLFLFMGIGGSVSRPYLNNMETLARTDALDGLIPLQVLVESQIRSLGSIEQIFDGYAELGYDYDKIALMLASAKIQLPEAYNREAFLRNEITQSEYRTNLKKLGYLEADIPLIEKLIQNVPPVSDGILFAVREAYDEQLADELKLDSDYESINTEFEAILQANGIDKQYAKYYWRSHWQLPSPTQLYNMLWRGLIDIDELDTALKASDYSPQWRTKLRDIAYKEYPRVDIRRMHKLGLLTNEEVVESYKRIGFPQDKAEKFGLFTQELNKVSDNPDVLNLTTSAILKAMVNKVITEPQAITALEANGLNTQDISVLIDNANISYHGNVLGDITTDNISRIIRKLSIGYIEGVLSQEYVRTEFTKIGYSAYNVEKEIEYLKIERAITMKEETIDIVLNQFLTYQIDRNSVLSSLGSMGFSSDELINTVDLWQQVREDRKTLPTKAEAKGFFEEGKITRNEYENILRGRGIAEKYISMY